MSDAIIRLPVRSAVRNRIVDRIIKGALRSGSAINLASLAAELTVSPTPLREALIELERDGFVECSQGRGFFVRAYSVTEINDLYPLISELEVLGLRTSPRPDPTRLRRLERINSELRDADDPAAALELDTFWHNTLLAECSNGILIGVLAGLKQRAQRYELAFLKESGHKVSTEQHSGIVRSLRAKDINRAAALLRENWNIGPRFLVPWLKARETVSAGRKQ